MKEFFQSLFEYNEKVNSMIIEAITANSDHVDSRTLDLASHILIVHELWNKRALQLQAPGNFWLQMPVNEMQQKNKDENAMSLSILSEREMDETIRYTNSKG